MFRIRVTLYLSGSLVAGLLSASAPTVLAQQADQIEVDLPAQSLATSIRNLALRLICPH